MRTMAKRALSGVLVASLMFSLCACGGGKEEAQSEQTTEEAVAESAVAVAEGSSEEAKEADTESVNGEEEKKEADITELKLGDSIDLDFVSMTLDKVEVADRYEINAENSDNGITTSYSDSIEPDNSGMKLLVLRGKFTNKSSSEVYTNSKPSSILYGLFIVNGNEYKPWFSSFDIAKASRNTSIVSQQEVDYFMYVEIPTSVIESNIESCTIQIGFMNGLDVQETSKNTSLGTISDFDYRYSIAVDSSSIEQNGEMIYNNGELEQ